MDQSDRLAWTLLEVRSYQLNSFILPALELRLDLTEI